MAPRFLSTVLIRSVALVTLAALVVTPLAQARGDRKVPRRAGILVPARPDSPAEEAFARAYAKEIERALLRVTEAPNRTFARGTFEARLRETFLRLDAPTRAAIVERARARHPVSRSAERPSRGRARMAGRRDVRGDASRLDPDLRRLLRDAIHARLDARLGRVKETALGSNTWKPVPMIRTWVEVGSFSKEIVTDGHTAITIHHPDRLEFRWWTEHGDAEVGRWELRGPMPRGPVLATGTAGSAPKSVFQVDLAKFLPATPPTSPLVYHLRVQPRTEPSISQVPGTRPGDRSVVKTPSEGAGAWSAPVVITYAAATAPPQTFDFPQVYRRVAFHLDQMHMVDDQSGPGTEEFYLAGFIQEGWAGGAGIQKKIPAFYAELDPGGRRWQHIGRHWTFHLNDPDTPQWPRFYSVVLSLIEVDSGNMLDDWFSAIWQAAHEVLASEVYDIVGDYIEDFVEKYGKEALEQAVQWGSQIAQWIAMIANEVSVTVVGMVVAVAAYVVAAIIAGMDDEYYGTESYTLVLPTNETDYVRGLPGKALPGGGYRLESERLQFMGHASWPSATKYDGIIDVYGHFRFTYVDDLR